MNYSMISCRLFHHGFLLRLQKSAPRQSQRQIWRTRCCLGASLGPAVFFWPFIFLASGVRCFFLRSENNISWFSEIDVTLEIKRCDVNSKKKHSVEHCIKFCNIRFRQDQHKHFDVVRMLSINQGFPIWISTCYLLSSELYDQQVSSSAHAHTRII